MKKMITQVRHRKNPGQFLQGKEIKNWVSPPAGLHLPANEALFRALNDNALINLYVIQNDRLMYVNQGMARLFGYEAEELIGAAITQIIHPEDHALALENVRRRLAGEVASLRYEVRGRCKNGETIYGEVLGVRACLNGHPVIVGAAIGFSERRRAEAEIAKSQALLNVILNSTADMIWSVDSQSFGLMSWNQTLYRYFQMWDGITLEPGMRPEDLFPSGSSHIQFWRESYQRVLNSGSFTAEYQFSAAHCILQLNFNRLEQGEQVFGISVFGKDITAQKTAEALAEKALAEKETLLRELHHRTKNNMNVILALLQMQADASDDEALRKALQETRNRIYSMSLVHQKLYEARHLSRINLKEYINDLVELLLSGYEISSERIVYLPEMEDVFTLLDTAIPCGLILNDLISNVLEHAFPGGRQGEIRVQLQRTENDEIILCVSDNGVGAPPGFDPRENAGLGLQTVFILAESQLKGRLYFDATQGMSCRLQFKDDLYHSRV